MSLISKRKWFTNVYPVRPEGPPDNSPGLSDANGGAVPWGCDARPIPRIQQTTFRPAEGRSEGGLQDAVFFSHRPIPGRCPGLSSCDLSGRRNPRRRPSINLPDNRRGEKFFAPTKNQRRMHPRRTSITLPDNRRGEKSFAPTKTQHRNPPNVGAYRIRPAGTRPLDDRSPLSGRLMGVFNTPLQKPNAE